MKTTKATTNIQGKSKQKTPMHDNVENNFDVILFILMLTGISLLLSVAVSAEADIG